MENDLLLVGVGLAIGILGALIGVGGGFILMPILLVLYPRDPPELLTSISLATVFFNTLSGAIAYARMKRIHYPSGVLFAAATIPGAILGTLTTPRIPRNAFDVVFGVLMIAAATFLLARSGSTGESAKTSPGATHGVLAPPANYSKTLGVGISLFVGYLSTLLGMGGGILQVPALIQLLGFPVHLATATSLFILAIRSLTGTAVHIATGVFSHGAQRTLLLSAGTIVGAQFGARLSNRVHGRWIVRALALSLGFVGVRLIWAGR